MTEPAADCKDTAYPEWNAIFGDIANVFIGGLFVGCATVIAGMLIPTS